MDGADKTPQSCYVTFSPFLSLRTFAFASAIYFHSLFELLSVSTVPLPVEQYTLFQPVLIFKHGQRL